MNVTNFKVKFNHFVISKAFHSSSGISLVGKRKGDYLCFPVFWDKFVGFVSCVHSFKLDEETEVGRMLMKVFPMHVLIYMHVVVHSTWRISKLSVGSPTPNHIKYCTTLDTNSETYLCTILLCAFFIIIFVYTFGAIFGILKFSLRVVNAPCSVPTQYPHFLIYNQSKYEHIKKCIWN